MRSVVEDSWSSVSRRRLVVTRTRVQTCFVSHRGFVKETGLDPSVARVPENPARVRDARRMRVVDLFLVTSVHDRSGGAGCRSCSVTGRRRWGRGSNK